MEDKKHAKRGVMLARKAKLKEGIQIFGQSNATVERSVLTSKIAIFHIETGMFVQNSPRYLPLPVTRSPSASLSLSLFVSHPFPLSLFISSYAPNTKHAKFS